MRQMGDIDLLAPKEHLSRASEILCDLGYVQLADAAYDDIQEEARGTRRKRGDFLLNFCAFLYWSR